MNNVKNMRGLIMSKNFTISWKYKNTSEKRAETMTPGSYRIGGKNQQRNTSYLYFTWVYQYLWWKKIMNEIFCLD